jgi:hypothetical protein
MVILDSSGSEQEPVEGLCDRGNKRSGSMKCRENLEYLSN